MNLTLLPDGVPGEHLGISHTLKHYLDPREMWQDIADDIPEHLRPREALASLGALTHAAHAQHDAPEPGLVDQWTRLRSVYRQGYGALITRRASVLPAPDRDGPWVYAGYRMATTLPGGVALIVRREGDRWRLHTAFRPANFKLTRYDCPPRDETSVLLRRKLAEIYARRWLETWRPEERRE